ncbi:hypothetical protein [Gimesia maris]|uniref:Uncharacterized protein n=1 Tax=Gimesia maris TaxID=122 RepID=A0ABX5YIP4_9PLAN|nr:hypothetical protein [Gimesia maris]EDL58258.1 hypothetical protein PM8797T_17022 [Gimesia maris DSM 8797]QEG15536.1 hypothetical protein GmarT_13770 [Gimesia maris]QGQ31166.1 hypothetical protein F1729_22410 [Gimesia maris]
MAIFVEILKIFLGAFIGFLSGLWAARKLLTESEKVKRKQLLDGLKLSIEHNNDLLAGLLNWVSDSG